MKNLFLGLTALVITTTITIFSAEAQEQGQIPAIPIDGAVRIGKLDNGLTYYIRHNEEPKGQANFYIAQKVGSILEEEDQRGLAHFLEHMCFNGTEKFPENGVVKYCEKIGVKFGADLNAYTSIDETVYNIDNVPVNKFPEAVDSCLWILHDWADGLLLNGDDIDNERGVIHEEWRSRSSAQMRMYEVLLPKIYPNNRYGQRLPIGLMSVIDNFPHDALRNYYEKWYRPDQQAIVVVGDLDLDAVENKIKEIFSIIKAQDNPAERVYFKIENNEEPIVAMAKDKEQTYAIAQIDIKHDPYPSEMKGSFTYYAYNFAINAAQTMLSARIQELLQSANPPFIQGSISDDEFMLSKTENAFSGTVVSSETGLKDAYSTIYREMLRAIRGGFTESEYERAKAQIQTGIESAYNQREKRKSAGFCKEYVRHFIDNEPIPGIENEYAFSQQIIPSIPVEMVNKVIASFGEHKGNIVAIFMLPDKEDVTYQSEDEVKATLKAVEEEEIPAYVDQVSDKPLLSKEPTAGKIVKVKEAEFGYRKYTLSNGATVFMKKTDFNKDQILMSAQSDGGTSLYSDIESNELKAVSEAMTFGGVGEFSKVELRKVLAGKKVSVSPSIGLFSENISASTTPKYIETMFQLNYLYFTSVREDSEAYTSWKTRTIASIKNRNADPTAALMDSVYKTIYKDDIRFSELTVEEVEAINYKRMLEIAKERFSNAADFKFIITGNYDEETIIPLIEKYIASLPSTGKKEKPDVSIYDLKKGFITNSFETKMETPTVNNLFVDNGTIAYNLKNRLAYNLAIQALNIVFTEEIREKEGGTYGVSCSGSVGGYPTMKSNMQIFYQTSPEKYEYLNDRIREIVSQFETNGPSDENLDKGKQYLIKKYHENLKENSFYASSLSELLTNKVDQITDYEAVVNSITKEDVRKVFSLLQKQFNHAEIIQVGTK